MVEESSHDELSMMEAVNILSNMSEIDSKEFSKQETFEEEELDLTDINWKDPRHALRHEPLVRETFRVLHRYLQNMVRKDQNILKDAQTLKGIQALMLLAKEAATKMDKYAKLNPEKHKPVSSLKEYTDLQKYYRQHILNQMHEAPEVPEDWEEALEDSLGQMKVTQKGLSDLEMVRRDGHYELFYIKDENGKPYFNKSLLRHIRLIGNFDELIGKVEGEDPLLALREVLDREMHEGAIEMLKSMATYIDEFYKEAKIEKDKLLVWNMNKALMALRMAANPKNLIENQSFKSCLEYYCDFHRFLRLSLQAPGYYKRISGEMSEDRFGHTMMRMTHALCCNLFMRKEPKRLGLKWIHEIIKRGDQLLGPRPKPKKGAFFDELVDQDNALRHLLKHYPNGPILRILDSLREEEELEGFDPLTHRNFPAQMFNLENKHSHITVLRIACPTIQETIHQAEIVEEFLGFLRFYKYDLKADKHLLVNVQNRTSWEEYARCQALENTAKRAEFIDQFFLLGLANGTPFFLQEDEYAAMSGAPIFFEQFADQILSGVECGYSLPSKVKVREHEDFIKEGMKVCHELFFEGKTTLTKDERLSFIDIFHIMYTLKMLDLLEIDSVSFSCKDAIDTGMVQTALFYTFTRLISDPNSWGGEDKNHLLWILYAPALFIRERAVHKALFDRGVMAMRVIEKACSEKGKEIAKELRKVYNRIQFPFDFSV